MATFESDHLCWKALAISLVLHGLLLGLDWPASRGSESAAERLRVVLRPTTTGIAAAPRRLPAGTPGSYGGFPSSAVAGPMPSTAAIPIATGNDAVAEDLSGPDADGLRAYRVGLAVAVQPLFRRPETARWRGSLELRLTVAAGGGVVPELVRPSGLVAMDAAAVEMLRRAAAVTAVPDTLRGRSFSVSLPMEFSPAD